MEEKYQNMHIGTANLSHKTASTKVITKSVMELYERIINKNLLVRRVNITANNIVSETFAIKEKKNEQLDMFGDFQKRDMELQEEKEEKQLQKSILDIKRKYGKNAIVKGMNLEEAGTTIERNSQVGGHKA